MTTPLDPALVARMVARGWEPPKHPWSREFRAGSDDGVSMAVRSPDGTYWVTLYGVPGNESSKFTHYGTAEEAADEAEGWLRQMLCHGLRFPWLCQLFSPS